MSSSNNKISYKMKLILQDKIRHLVFDEELMLHFKKIFMRDETTGRLTWRIDHAIAKDICIELGIHKNELFRYVMTLEQKHHTMCECESKVNPKPE